MNSPSPSKSLAALQATPADLPKPTAEQQHLLDRIAMQRDRIQARRAARAQSVALSESQSTVGGVDDPLAMRLLGFARAHPLAVLGMVGVAAVAGPRRLVRWTSVLLPFLLKLRR